MTVLPEEELRILWQDEYYALIYKPAGLLVHPSVFSSSRDTLIRRLYRSFDPPPLPVHRLDRPVSGILAGAFCSKDAAALSALFREGQVVKRYWAILRGHCPVKACVEVPLKNHDTGKMQEARSLVRRLALCEIPIPSRRYDTSRYSLAEISLDTGRFHQIRRHLAGLGYPVIGDTSHGDTYSNHHFEAHFGVKGLLLHSRSLSFIHPRSGGKISVAAPLPPRFMKAFEALGWREIDFEKS